MFEISLAPAAVRYLRSLRKYDQARVVSAIESQLAHEPHRETRNRKRLRPNALAEWELRVDDLRVFYDVRNDDEGSTVNVVALGYKVGNELFVHGEKFEL